MQIKPVESRAQTLFHKAKYPEGNGNRRAGGGRGFGIRVAPVLGMHDEAREALRALLDLAQGGPVAVAGRFMPDTGVGALLASRGIVEEVGEGDFARFRKVVVPFGGVAAERKRAWREAGHPVEDLSSPQVRRAQVALGLLRVEGARGLVIGRHDDPESLAIAGGSQGALILEDTTDTARLRFAPAFGVVCQTTLSPRRVRWLAEQLRFRWRDARVTFLDTLCPSMGRREQALEQVLGECKCAVVVGDAGEASCEALVEAASRCGKPALRVAGPEELDARDFPSGGRVALSAGAFATDTAVRAVAGRLAEIGRG